MCAGHVRNTAGRQRGQKEKTDEREGDQTRAGPVSSLGQQDNPPLPHAFAHQ